MMEGTHAETPRRSIVIDGHTKDLKGKTEKNHTHKRSPKRFNLNGTHGHCQGHFCCMAPDGNSTVSSINLSIPWSPHFPGSVC